MLIPYILSDKILIVAVIVSPTDGFCFENEILALPAAKAFIGSVAKQIDKTVTALKNSLNIFFIISVPYFIIYFPNK